MAKNDQLSLPKIHESPIQPIRHGFTSTSSKVCRTGFILPTTALHKKICLPLQALKFVSPLFQYVMSILFSVLFCMTECSYPILLL